MIQIENLNFSYGNVEVLKDINLEINQGSFAMLLGPSGCGKTTLLNIIGLMSPPTSGVYYLNNIDMSKISGQEAARLRNQNIGFVFQAYHLISHLNVLDNVALPLGYAGVNTNDRRSRARESLMAVGLEDKANNLPSELSGGQRQRVAIARATVINPLMIIADEPTGNLDSDTGQTIMQYFKLLNDEGVTIIMSTHNKELTSYATEIIMMRDGMIDRIS